jgi:murein L,D-transpeptidase YcbB/YkuD
VAAVIAARLEAPSDFVALADCSLDARSLAAVYVPRGYRPLWSQGPRLRPEVSELRAALDEAASHGLDPAAYPTAAIEQRLAQVSAEARAELDLLLSASLAAYVADLRAGRSDPLAAGEALLARPPRPDAATVLGQAFDGPGLAAVLRAAPPQHAEYRRLRRALALYRRLEASGGWPMLADGPTLELGSTGLPTRQLCRRLAREDGYRGRCDGDGQFDVALEAAVRSFQRRHGLESDGRVGPRTRTALNHPPSYWARRIALNLERWRWLPPRLGPRFVFVNLPSFELRLTEGGRTTLRTRVIAGTTEHPTPLLHSHIVGLSFNPPWRVPASIAAEKLLPQILADPDLLTRDGYEVLPPGPGSEPMPAERVESIDWQAVDPEQMELRLRQRPGPRNALGRIRFDVINDRGIYLHDTPARHLFRRSRRAASWGCVRLEHARELAAVLLADDADWSRERIEEEIESAETREVRLGEAVPLYVVYLTARIAEADAELQFFDDVYERDARLQAVFDGTAGRIAQPRSGLVPCEGPQAAAEMIGSRDRIR